MDPPVLPDRTNMCARCSYKKKYLVVSFVGPIVPSSYEPRLNGSAKPLGPAQALECNAVEWNGMESMDAPDG